LRPMVVRLSTEHTTALKYARPYPPIYPCLPESQSPILPAGLPHKKIKETIKSFKTV
jgi:hypothetical protein